MIGGVSMDLKQEVTVKCCNCNFVGAEEDLEYLKDENGCYNGCPNCKTDKYLSDIE